MVMVNCDGAIFKDLGKVGIRVMVLDSLGLVLASMSETILSQSVADVEGRVAVRAVNFV